MRLNFLALGSPRPARPRFVFALLAAPLLGLGAPAASAQNVVDAFTPYVNAYDLRDLDHDGNGHLWAASMGGGAVRYDLAAGTWTQFPKLLNGPRGNDLATLCIDGSGRVWTGSATRGYTFYDPATGRWDRLVDDWPDPHIRVIRCFGNGVYIGTQAGLTLKPSASRTDVCAPAAPGCIVPSYIVNDYALSGDTLWVATQAGLARFSGGTWDSAGTLPAGSVGSAVQSLALHRGVLFRAGAQGVQRLAGGAWVPTGLAADRLVAQGDTLFALRGSVREFYRWDDGQEAWRAVALSRYPDGDLNDVVQLGGVFYFATSRGISTAREGDSTFGAQLLPPGPPVASPVGGMGADAQGTVWAGTQESAIGLMSFNGDVWSAYTPADGLHEDWIFGVFPDRQGRVWVGHCCCGDNLNGCPIDLRLPSAIVPLPSVRNVYSLDEDSQGRIWTGTDGLGAYVLQDQGGNSWQPVLHLDQASTGARMASNFVRAVAVTPDGVYLGHLAAGLDYWPTQGNLAQGADGSNWIHLGAGASGLLDPNVTALTAVGSDVWLGTAGGGLHLLRGGVLQSRCPTRVSGQSGDQPRPVSAIVADRQGGIWIGTSGGVLYLPRGGTCDASGGEFTVFTTDNSALPDDQVTAGTLDPVDGAVWFGTRNGFLRIDPSVYTGGAPPAERYVLYPNPIDYTPGSPISLRRVHLGIQVREGVVNPVDRGAAGKPLVYDIAGQEVGEFEEDNTTGGNGSWSWDGKNTAGNVVAPGLYLVRARTGAKGTVVLRLGVVR